MDDIRTEGVIKVFCDLYRKGASTAACAWSTGDPAARTALSDEEVVFKESHGKLYTCAMRSRDGQSTSSWLRRAPETILGDTALCVNPDDERYEWLPQDARVVVPLVGRSIPVIRDTYVDIAFGTGALKVTPAHDVNDYMLGEKYGLETIDIFNDDGTINGKVGIYEGMDRFELRRVIEGDLQRAGLLEKTEEYTNNVGYSERTGVAIEPKLSMQWFLSMEELAKPLRAPSWRTNLLSSPKNTNIYRHWMENIKDWCISRQLWWGAAPPGLLPAQRRLRGGRNGRGGAGPREKTGDAALQLGDLRQDEDVLDTWFSSWLWPISVFDGIRNPDNEEIRYYYPDGRSGDGPRHHLLLGGAHDHGRLRISRREALRQRLFHRHRARQDRTQDVQAAGQPRPIRST